MNEVEGFFCNTGMHRIIAKFAGQGKKNRYGPNLKQWHRASDSISCPGRWAGERCSPRARSGRADGEAGRRGGRWAVAHWAEQEKRRGRPTSRRSSPLARSGPREGRSVNAGRPRLAGSSRWLLSLQEEERGGAGTWRRGGTGGGEGLRQGWRDGEVTGGGGSRRIRTGDG